MITKSIIKAAEKAIPFEEKLIAFFSKKVHRLIILGAVAVICSLVFWETMYHYYPDILLYLRFTLLIFLAITAAAGFFSSIGQFSLLKYTFMSIIAAAVHFFGFYVFGTGSIDFTVDNALVALLMWCLEFAAKSYTVALILSLLTGLIISRKRI